jgi:hypothetical protein
MGHIERWSRASSVENRKSRYRDPSVQRNITNRLNAPNQSNSINQLRAIERAVWWLKWFDQEINQLAMSIPTYLPSNQLAHHQDRPN